MKLGYKTTEVGTLPEDWEVKLLPDVCQFRGGKAHERYISDSGRFVCVNSKFIATDGKIRKHSTANFCSAKRNDILMVMSDLPNGRALAKAYLADDDDLYAVNQRVCALTPYSDCPKYIFYVLNRNPYFLKFDDGVNQTHLLNHVFQKCRFALPPTVSEQEAIAEALSDADAFIESLEQLIGKKYRVKQGVMREILSGNRRLRGFEVKEGYKQSDVGVIPKDWNLRPLLTAVRIAQGQVNPKIEPYRSMFLVGPVHVESGTGRLLNRQTAAEQGAISGKYLFAKDDIVYGKIRPYLQKAFLADFDGLCSADMYPLKPSEDVSPGFVFAVVLGHQFTKYAESVSVRSGMPKINRVEMGGFVFPIPSDKTEQSAIAAMAFDMDEEIAALEARLAKARRLKQGMMQQLLTGKVRLV
jgi:type I restriction enzyme S subunit